jgi:hypothetical protein
MLGSYAKIDAPSAKCRHAVCSAGLSAQHLRLPTPRSLRENHDVLSGHDFLPRAKPRGSHAARVAKSKRLQPLRSVLSRIHTHPQLQRHSNSSLERQSHAHLSTKTDKSTAPGGSKNVSVRKDLDPLFSMTYGFFNCTLVSVRNCAGRCAMRLIQPGVSWR